MTCFLFQIGVPFQCFRLSKSALIDGSGWEAPQGIRTSLFTIFSSI